jgi:hypothetical protein
VNDARSELKGNRFEAALQRWRAKKPARRRTWLRVLAVLLALEFVSLGFTFVWYGVRGVQSQQFLDKFLLTRHTLSPLLFDNPAKSIPGIRYLGTKESLWTSARWHVADPILGWRLNPGTSMLKQPNEVWNLVGWRMANPQGFAAAGALDYAYAVPKPPNVYRVIVTGGSTVEGDGAETPLDNLPSKLFEALRSRASLPPGKDRLEVINAGVGAYGSGQEYLYIATELLDYEPDLIVSYGGAVDFRLAKRIYDQQGRVHDSFRLDKHEEYARRLNRSYTVPGAGMQFLAALASQALFFLDELAIVYVAEKAYEKILKREEKIGEATVVAEPSDDGYIDAAVKIWTGNLRLMAMTLRDRAVPVLFILHPMMASPNKPYAEGTEARMRQRMSEREVNARLVYFAKAGAVLRDLESHFTKTSQTCFADLTDAFDGVTERVYEDTSHILGSGNRIMADRIVESLERCDLIRAKGP